MISGSCIPHKKNREINYAVASKRIHKDSEGRKEAKVI